MKTIFAAMLVFFYCNCTAQWGMPVSIVQPAFSPDDQVTIIYDASKGDRGLYNFTSDIYMYAGVLTASSNGPGDWKYVTPNNWSTIASANKVSYLGSNLFSITLVPRTYFNIPVTETVTAIAMVFRSADLSLTGRGDNGSDIIYYMNTCYGPAPFGTAASASVLASGALKISMTSLDAIYILPFSNDIIKTELVRGCDSLSVSDIVIMNAGALNGTLADEGSSFVYTFNDKKITIQKSPLKIAYYKNNKLLLEDAGGFGISGPGKSASFRLQPNEQVYGLGSHGVNQNRRGKSFTINNKQVGGYGASGQVNDLNINIPFFISSNNYGVYFDHYYNATADIGLSQSDVLKYSIDNGSFSYYVVCGDDYAGILKNYTALTGRQPLPPRWALGYIQSKYGYHSQSETTAIVNTIKAAGFPLDAIVLDLYWFGDIQNMGNLSWDLNNFPNPQQMMAGFASSGVKTIVITEPDVVPNSVNMPVASSSNLLGTKNNTPYIFKSWSGWPADSLGLLDVTNPATQSWMWQKYKARMAEGVNGFWCDLGEPEQHPSDMMHYEGSAGKIHNRFSLRWAKFLFEKHASDFPDKRWFNLIRSGYAGMQRYSAIPWSGDVAGTFNALALQIPIMLGMGMSGAAYMHADCGGFTNAETNPELFTRWAQFACFSPVLRFHGNGNSPVEPVNYANPYKDIVRQYIRLRYQLLPYNYSLAFENSLAGLPLARPMNFYENTTALADINDQYFWGENFIIAPILTAGATSRTVRLPSGTWYDYDTHKAYAANTTVNISSPINKIPILVKGGSLIPICSDTLGSTDDYHSNNLTITYFPAAGTSAYTMYNDDGASASSIMQNNYEEITMTKTETDTLHKEFVLHSAGNYNGKPGTRIILFHLINQPAPTEVLLNDVSLPQMNSYLQMTGHPQSYFYDSIAGDLYATGRWTTEDDFVLKISGSTANSAIAAPDDTYKIYPNPATDKLLIEISKISVTQLREIDVLNAMGQVLMNYTPVIQQKIYTLNVSQLPAGIYFVRLKSAEAYITKKVNIN